MMMPFASRAIWMPIGLGVTSTKSKYVVIKGGRRKKNQAAYEVKGFRLFDKVRCDGQIGFIFGRRSRGYFDVRRLDGTRISACAKYNKLRLLQKRKSYLTELRT